MVATTTDIWTILGEVTDPEIPVLTIHDLGIVRDVKIHPDETVEVIITPTYSGCPAMHTIEINIIATLQENGFDKIKVTTVLSPAWTTDWLTEAGREKLKAYGIAPPAGSTSKRALFGEEPVVEYRCKDCLEPFDYFKCH